MKKKYLVITTVLVLLFSVSVHAFSFERELGFSGWLTNNSNGTLVNESIDFNFILYDAATGGTVLASNAETISVTNGFYSTLIDVSGLTDYDKNMWLDISIGGNTLGTRHKVVPRLAAYEALNAQSTIASHSSLTNLNWTSSGHTIDGNFDVNNNAILNTNYIDFNLTDSNPGSEGRLKWNSVDGTLEVGMPGGNVNLQIGQEQLLRAKNTEGSQINNGQAVFISGASGSRPEVQLANNNVEAEAHGTIAIATEDVSNNQNGFFTTFGVVRDINTSSFSVGDLLYLGTGGNLINSMPLSPLHAVEIGYVLESHATQGDILVRVKTSPDLNDLDDILLTNPSNGQGLTYDSGSGLWVNTTLSTGDVTAVGDCATGDCFSGTSGTTLTFNNAGGDKTLGYDGSDFDFDAPVTVNDSPRTVTLGDAGQGDAFNVISGTDEFRLLTGTQVLYSTDGTDYVDNFGGSGYASEINTSGSGGIGLGLDDGTRQVVAPATSVFTSALRATFGTATLDLLTNNHGLDVKTSSTNDISILIDNNMDFGATWGNNVADPIQAQDIATKAYVDSQAGVTDTNAQTACDDNNILLGNGNCIGLTGADINMSHIQGATFYNVQHLQDVFHSAGHTSGGTINDAGSGNITVDVGSGLLRISNGRTNRLDFFDWSALGSTAIPSDTVRYVGVEYNGGSPQVVVRTTYNWNFNTDFPLGNVINEGGTLYIENAPHSVGDHANFMIQRAYETMPFERDDKTGGLILGETGTRNVTVSAGALWERLQRFSIGAIDTSGADTFDRYYRDGVGGWTIQTSQTQWDNAQYDDGSGTLAALANNRYSVQYFYLELDGSLISIYGQNEYTSLALAESDSPPSSVPDRVNVQSTLIGRIIFQEAGATAESVESVYTTTFSGAVVSDHGSLAGLSDNDHPQYLLVTDYSDSNVWSNRFLQDNNALVQDWNFGMKRIYGSNSNLDVNLLNLGNEGLKATSGSFISIIMDVVNGIAAFFTDGTSTVEIVDGTWALDITGDVNIDGNVLVGNQWINSLADPIQAQDAATKNYVDTELAGVSGITDTNVWSSNWLVADTNRLVQDWEFGGVSQIRADNGSGDVNINTSTAMIQTNSRGAVDGIIANSSLWTARIIDSTNSAAGSFSDTSSNIVTFLDGTGIVHTTSSGPQDGIVADGGGWTVKMVDATLNTAFSADDGSDTAEILDGTYGIDVDNITSGNVPIRTRDGTLTTEVGGAVQGGLYSTDGTGTARILYSGTSMAEFNDGTDMVSVLDSVSGLNIDTSASGNTGLNVNSGIANIAIDATGDVNVDGNIYATRAFIMSHDTELTIATGAVTVVRNFHNVDTQGDASTDDLDTINGGQDGMQIILKPNSNVRDVIVKDNTGNLQMNGDFNMNNINDTITFINDGSNWLETSRSDNGG